MLCHCTLLFRFPFYFYFIFIFINIYIFGDLLYLYRIGNDVIPNDIKLGDDSSLVLVLTGPNMYNTITVIVKCTESFVTGVENQHCSDKRVLQSSWLRWVALSLLPNVF